MKYVRVFVQDHGINKVGDIFDVSSQVPVQLLESSLQVVETDDSFDLETMKAVIGDPIAGSFLPRFEIAFEIDQAKAAAKAVKQKEAQVAALYKTMDDAVFSKVEEVFKTKRPDSATATALTYVLMYLVPEKFADKGLKNGNVALDTDVKVKIFAEQMVDQIVDHAVFRIQEIEKFKTAKDEVIGG